MVRREQIASAWDFPSVPGTKSVANADEDSLTMGFEAGFDCLKGIDASEVDALLFASTTAPYLEKSSASIIATALDLRKDILTTDVGNSLKAGTTALLMAVDMIDAGRANNVLVIAADKRNPEPMSMYEYGMGDAAAALLVSKGGNVLEVVEHASTSEDLVGPWRRDKDDYIRQSSGKYDSIAGYGANMIAAGKAVLAKAGVAPGDIAKACIYGADPKSPSFIAKKLGISSSAVQDGKFMELGDTGNPQCFLTLMNAIRRGKDGELILLGGYGDGADMILLKVVDKKGLKALKGSRRGVLIYSALTEVVDTYNKYLFFRNSLGKEPYTRKTSTVTVHRDGNFLLRWHGAKCKACGTLQYPIWRSCIEPSCMKTGPLEETKLGHRGKIFTFTLDHLEGGDYYETPIPRCVIDLEGGGRVFLNMTDCKPDQVHIGMEVETTLRMIHEGGDFYNYYYKCRPVRETGGSSKGG